MNSAPTVEVLIVSYNTRDLLAECLRSIAAHLPPTAVAQVGIRVLDNDSTDGSVAMIERAFPDVSVERAGENLGFARANNLMAHSSNAHYVMLLNPDTRWTEDVVGPLLDVLRQWPRAIAVGPRLIWPDGTRQRSAHRFPTLGYELATWIQGTPWRRLLRPFWDPAKTIDRIECPDIDLYGPSETPALWATCWLLRRSDIATNGLFDERYATYDEDLDFCRRMFEKRRTFIYEPRVVMTHVGGGSSSGPVKRELTRRSRGLYYRLHHGRTTAFVYTRGLGGLRRLDALLPRLIRRRRREPQQATTSPEP